MKSKNWFTVGVWIPIETLSKDFKGPVVFADKTKTIHWYAENADRTDVEYIAEHLRDPATNEFLYDDKGKPKLKKGKAAPAFWQVAHLVEVTE